MKLKRIKKEITNDIIIDHLANGWILDWDDASRGNKTTQFFTKDGQLRCLIVEEESNFGMGLDKLVVRLVSIESWWESPCGGFSWGRDSETAIYSKTYFEVDEDWYVEDEAEANAILMKKRERIKNSPNPRFSDVKTLQPSEALIALLRKRAGDEKLTSKRIRVMKCIEHRFLGGMNMVYKVEILNRIGNVKQTLLFPLHA